jgi:hypothetical protein
MEFPNSEKHNCNARQGSKINSMICENSRTVFEKYSIKNGS